MTVRSGFDLPSRPVIMGVVNVTPDSFSDGGRFLAPEAAISHGLALLRDGADILDIGGESTSPLAQPVEASEELARVVPVIRALAAHGAKISIDTTKAQVAEHAVAAGACIVNDVSGGLFDPELPRLIAELGVTYIVGHLRGRSLAEVFAAEAPVCWHDVRAELADRLAEVHPSARERVWVDPGLGFGKGADPEANLELLRRSGELAASLGAPVVVGPSRKRFVRRLLEQAGCSTDLAGLDAASSAACLYAARVGARILRVHNVALLRAALAVYTRL